MPADNEFIAHCRELLGTLGPTRARRMFGGHGLYVDDVFIAFVASDRLYLKADAQTQPKFEAAGCEQMVVGFPGREIALRYWAAPEDAMESPGLMHAWARLAMEAGLRARNAKPVRKPKLSPAPAARSPRRRGAAPTKR